MAFLERFTTPTYALMRMVAGFLFWFHGGQKIFGILGRTAVEVGTQAWIGGVIEIVTGVLITVGLFTRPAAFLASGTMAVAYVQFHWKGQLGAEFLPIVNRGELSVIYAFVFLYIACKGAGAFSLDHLRARK